PRFPSGDPLRIGPAVVALVGLGGAFAATRAPTLLGAMISTGLTGFAVALTFMMNGAPDLALTQFAVEVLLVVLLTALLLAVPLATPQTRTPVMRRVDATVACAIGALLFLGIIDMAADPEISAASRFYGQAA